MGDVANILGVQQSAPSSAAEETNKILHGAANKNKMINKSRVPKPKGMSRELFSLMGVDSMVPAVATNTSALAGIKNKRSNVNHGKWTWAPFTTSARR